MTKKPFEKNGEKNSAVGSKGFFNGRDEFPKRQLKYSENAKDKSVDLMMSLDNEYDEDKLRQLLATVYREGFTDGFKTGTEFNEELKS